MSGSEESGRGHLAEVPKADVTELGFSQAGNGKSLKTLRQVNATVGLHFRSAQICPSNTCLGLRWSRTRQLPFCSAELRRLEAALLAHAFA